MTANPIEKNPGTLKELGTYLDLDLTTMLIPAAQVSGVVGGSSANLVTALNVKRDYGAVGDGVADDRVAIQNAINAASSAGQGGVYFPPGIYKIGAALAPKANVALFGSGPRSSILKPATSGLKMLDDTVGVAGWSVDRLGFDLSSFTDTFGIRLQAAGSNYVSITNCEFKNIDSGTSAESAAIIAYTGVLYARIENCTFIGAGNSTTNSYTSKGVYGTSGWSNWIVRGCLFVGMPLAISLDNVTKFLVSENRFASCGVDAVSGGGCTHGAISNNVFTNSVFPSGPGSSPGAVAFGQSGSNRSHDLVISGNKSEAGGIIGIYGGYNVTISGNEIHGATAGNIEVNNGFGPTNFPSEKVVIANNISDGSASGIQMACIEGVVIGNICRNGTNDGIDLFDCQKCVVIGNQCVDNAFQGIYISTSLGLLLTGASDILVANNHVTGNGLNGILVESNAGCTRIRLEFNYLIGNSGSPISVGALATHTRRFGNITANADYDQNLFSPVAAFALTYGVTVNTDASQSTYFTLAVTNGTAFTIAAPTNPVAGDEITYDIKNSSGGAHGVITWNAAFLNGGAGTVGTGAFAGIANGKRRLVVFRYDGTSWIEQSRTADV